MTVSDIENASKAQQCAQLLRADIQDLVKSKNPFVSDLGLLLMVEVGGIETALGRLNCNLELLNKERP